MSSSRSEEETLKTLPNRADTLNPSLETMPSLVFVTFYSLKACLPAVVSLYVDDQLKAKAGFQTFRDQECEIIVGNQYFITSFVHFSDITASLLAKGKHFFQLHKHKSFYHNLKILNQNCCFWVITSMRHSIASMVTFASCVLFGSLNYALKTCLRRPEKENQADFAE